MAIQRELTTDEFNAASVEDKALYSPGEGGKFIFVGENAGELRRAKARISSDLDVVSKERNELRAQLESYQKAKEQTDHDDKVKTKDVKTIDESWKARVAKLEQANAEKVSKLERHIIKSNRDSTITELANSLALPEFVDVFKSVLRERIGVKLDTDFAPIPVVYDSAGKETRDTIKELTADIKKDSRYKRLLKGADLRGSGATDSQQPASLPRIGDQGKQAQVSNLSTNFGRFLEAPPDQLEKMLGS